MTRTFIYNFAPPSLAPSPGATIALDVSEIEDAGIREVHQTPGAANGAWSILDALLATTGAGTSFLFRQPLGQAPRRSPLRGLPAVAYQSGTRGGVFIGPSPSSISGPA